MSGGHNGSTEKIDNFSRYTITEKGCWQWGGSVINSGYGVTSRPIFGTRVAHRVFYIQFVGRIPEGMTIDHLCRNRLCVNPEHMEVVTYAENNARAGIQALGKCRKGLHNITSPNAVRSRGNRVTCNECLKITQRRADVKRGRSGKRESQHQRLLTN